MTLAIHINDKDFPEAMKAINKLADKLASTPSTRPSIRKLAAEIILESCIKKLKELSAPETVNNSTKNG
jgi:hypothetical protein